jgi:hypothetical protein
LVDNDEETARDEAIVVENASKVGAVSRTTSSSLMEGSMVVVRIVKLEFLLSKC